MRLSDVQLVAATLAPTGRLRAAINQANPVLCTRPPEADAAGKGAAQNDGAAVKGAAVNGATVNGAAANVAPKGLAADLACELARRLGVPVELLPYTSARVCVQAVQDEEADIGFFAIDPLRAGKLHFTPPHVQMEGVYVVREQSALRSNEQVDAAGHRVAVGAGSAYALHLERELKQANIIPVPISPLVMATFMEQCLEAAAGVRQQMQADMAKWPGLRMLPGRFMAIHQALATSAGRGQAAFAFLDAFIEDVKASGWVARSLARHGVEGATVAAPGHPDS
jgi:polar amino acid transport system substrate-binding protein